MNDIWNCYCKNCESFCKYGKEHGVKKFWCNLRSISVMPFAIACKKYKEKIE